MSSVFFVTDAVPGTRPLGEISVYYKRFADSGELKKWVFFRFYLFLADGAGTFVGLYFLFLYFIVTVVVYCCLFACLFVCCILFCVLHFV